MVSKWGLKALGLGSQLGELFFSGGGERERRGGAKSIVFMLSLAAAVIPSQPSGLFWTCFLAALSVRRRASGRLVLGPEPERVVTCGGKVGSGARPLYFILIQPDIL